MAGLAQALARSGRKPRPKKMTRAQALHMAGHDPNKTFTPPDQQDRQRAYREAEAKRRMGIRPPTRWA